jgi:hypothetical protein
MIHELAFKQSSTADVERARDRGGQLWFIHGCPLCDNKTPHVHYFCPYCHAQDWAGPCPWCDAMRRGLRLKRELVAFRQEFKQTMARGIISKRRRT